jgi:type VI secretion system protein VasJ
LACRWEWTVSDLNVLASLGSSPVPGGNPAGASARYEPEFEKLSNEISKLESVEGRGTLHWDTVVESAAAILADKSKDLLVASYLTLGLLQESGYEGLSAGLRVCKDLMTTYWDSLFPEKSRMRARAQAIQWMAERIPPALAEKGDASRSDREPLQSATASLKEIAALSGQIFEDGGPILSELVNAVENKLATVPADEPPPSSEPSPASEAPTEPSSAPSAEAAPPPREMDSPEAAREALAEMRERRIKAAAILREADPASPLPYRLLRTAVWEDLVEAPASKDGVCEASGSDAGFASDMEGRLDRGEWAAVIAEVEAKLPSDPLWLDLNFIACRAMEGLGKPYAQARRALGDEVVRLLRFLPSLLDLKFADGTPLASEAARLWILHELGALSSAERKGPEDALEAALAEARKRVARKSFPEAAALLQKETGRGADRRDRFRGRLYLAKLCAEAGRIDLALPQLEGLDEEGRRYSLEEWEASLAAEVVRELWRAQQAASAPEKAAEYRARLCRLDLSAALAAEGAKKPS